MDTRISWIVIFLVAFFAKIDPVYAETYNFYFPKASSKKKSSRPKPVPEPEEGEESEEEGAPQEEEEAPVRSKRSRKGPIIIHNHNNIGYPSSAAPSPAPETPANSVAASQAVVPRILPSPWRLTLGATYFPGRRSMFPSYGLFSSHEERNAFGGFASLGYVCNSLFVLNSYFGVHTNGQTFYELGAEGELHPFGNGHPFDVNPLELGLLAGGSLGSADLINVHVGARLSVNLGSKIALTGTTRLGTNYVMVGVGLTTRL